MKFSKILPIMLSAFAGLANAAAKANDDLPSTDAVMNIFKQINKVPRPSKHEEKMVDWLENFAKTNKIEYVIDGKNVIMYKDGTTGMEEAPMLTLQGHMDMVAVHADNYDFDIYTQGVESEIVDGWMRSKDNKTSLGADDGIGISIMLAVLESNTIPHGPIECLFTWDEEQGFSGATSLTPGILKGKYLMNIDWETDEELCIGTAGGMGVAANLVYNVTATPDDYAAYKLSIIDVTGGHSGIAINFNPANANKLMSDFLAKQEGLRLSSINGGTFFNAITVKSEATVLVPEKNKKDFEKKWEEYATEVKEKFTKTDPDMKLVIKSAETPAESISEEHTKAIFAGLTNVPSGVTEWSKVVDGMFEVSNNMGPIRLEDGKFRVEMLVRGFNDKGIVDLADDIIKGFETTKVGFECEKYSSFSPWNADLDSPLMHYARKVYEDYFGKPVGLKKIGGGLELSEFALAYPDVPMMSYGPTIVDPHTINEKIKVDTIGHIWDYTLELLRNFNEIVDDKQVEDVIEPTETEDADDVEDPDKKEFVATDSEDDAEDVSAAADVIEDDEDSGDETSEKPDVDEAKDEEAKDEAKDKETKDEAKDEEAKDEAKDEETKDEAKDEETKDEAKDEEAKDEITSDKAEDSAADDDEATQKAEAGEADDDEINDEITSDKAEDSEKEDDATEVIDNDAAKKIVEAAEDSEDEKKEEDNKKAFEKETETKKSVKKCIVKKKN